MYNDAAKKLKLQTDVMKNTLEYFNLQIINFSYQPIDEDSASFKALVEIGSKNDEGLNCDVDLHINLYDDMGEIIASEENSLYEDDFIGYDTLVFQFYNDELDRAVSARIFATKS